MKQVIAFFLVALIAQLASCHHDPLSGLIKNWHSEFGKAGAGETICKLHGWTKKHHTEVDLPVPQEEIITYVKVVVKGVFEPRMNYDAEARTVCIDYDESVDVPVSRYEIVVQGVTRE